MYYVRLTTVAALMGVNDAWLRGLVYQRVMDDERETQRKGSPYVMHVQQCFQAIIAHRLRKRSVGYDLIRDAIWGLEFGGVKKHHVEVASGITLTLDRAVLTRDARDLLGKANFLEYGHDYEEAEERVA